MDINKSMLKRRAFLKLLGGLGAVVLLAPRAAFSIKNLPITKPIPSTGERLPVIGMGSWRTFDVGSNSFESAERVKVLQAFFDNGGALIDSSPMYGSSEEVIGKGLKVIKNKGKLFAATKVWILGKKSGIQQMETSQQLWGVKRFDLMQIHNMLDWETHWETLKDWKAAGRVRYIGITTSHGRRHDVLAKAMEKTPFDFVQFTYNLEDREVEQRLLPLAADRGMAVIINRPFQRGELFSRVRGKPLPPWAAEFDCQNWAQYLLTMQYLSEMTDEQTLVMYSGHPMGLFPSHKEAPRVVVTNGMMIPNYSKPDDWEKYNALGVTQYGQMTAGSYMYIGPQGIVHGTTITVLNGCRKIDSYGTAGKLFVFINVFCDILITQPKNIDEFYDCLIPDNLKESINKREDKT